MFGVTKRSLASWREVHGFGILNILSPTGERFFVEARVAAESSQTGYESWVDMSESELRQYLAERGFSDGDADAAIHLSRQWATTITNPSFFPAPDEARGKSR